MFLLLFLDSETMLEQGPSGPDGRRHVEGPHDRSPRWERAKHLEAPNLARLRSPSIDGMDLRAGNSQRDASRTKRATRATGRISTPSSPLILAVSLAT